MPSVGSVSVDVVPDARGFAEKLSATLRNQNVKVGLDLDDAGFRQKLEAATRGTTARVSVDLDDGVASARLAELTRPRSTTINADVDTGSAVSKLTAISSAANLGSLSIRGGLIAAGLAIAPAIVPTAGAAAAAVASIGIGATASAASLGVLVAGIAPIIKSVAEQTKATKAATSATIGLKQASDGVAAAQAAGASAARRAAQAVVDAQRGVADARRSAAQAVSAAIQQEEQAERRLSDALVRERRAQEDLTKARFDAKRALEDLNNAAVDGALSSRQAAIDLAQAKSDLDVLQAAAASTDPRIAKPSDVQLQNAQLAFEQAQQAQKEADLRASRSAQDATAANKAGVEGSPQVKDAKANLTDARQGVDDAREGVDQAQAAIQKARIDGARRVADAERAVTEAQIAQREQAEATARAVRAAQQQMVAANQILIKSTEATDGLTKPGRELADLITKSLIPGFKELSKQAQAPIAQGILNGLRAARPLLPVLNDLFRNLGEALGDIFENVGKALGSPFWKDFFTLVATTGGDALRGLASFLGDIMTGIAGVFTKFQPAGKAIGDILLDLSGRFKDFGTGKTDGLEKFFKYAERVGPKVSKFIGAVGDAIGTIVTALAPLGESILDTLTDFFGGIGKIDGEKVGKGLGKMADGISQIVRDLGKKIGPDVAKAIEKVTDFLSRKADQLTADTMSSVADSLAKIAKLGLDNLQKVIDFVDFFSTPDAASGSSGLSDFVSLLGGIAGAADTAAGAVASVIGTINDLRKKNHEKPGGSTYDKITIGFNKFVNQLISPELWGRIGDALSDIGHDVVAGLKHGIVDSVEDVLKAWNRLCNRVIDYVKDLFGIKSPSTVFAAIGKDLIRGLVQGITSLLNSIKKVWKQISDRFSDAWDAIREVIRDGISYVRTKISDGLGAIRDKFKDIWGKIRDVTEGLLGSDGSLRSIFRKGVDAIGSIWSGLQELAKKPIRFIVQTVLEDGLLAAFRSVSKAVGYKDGQDLHVSLPKGFADGGVLPGYTPGRDVHRFISATGGMLDLSGGEAIMRPEVTQALGRSWVDGANAAARSGGIGGVGKFLGGHQAHASGGYYRPVKGGSISQGLHDQYTGFPAIDFAIPTGTKVVAVADGRVSASRDIRGGGNGGYASYGRVIQILSRGFETLYAHLSKRGVAVGQEVSAGQLIGLSGNTGNSTGPHLHFGAKGINPFTFVGGKQGSTGVLGAVGDGIAAAVDYVGDLRKKFAGPLKQLDTLGSSPYAKLASGIPRTLATALLDKAKSFVTAPISGAVKFGKGVLKKGEILSVLTTALGLNRLPITQLDNWYRQVMSESGGNAGITQQISDINSASGNRAQGLLQVIPPTFRAYRSKLLPNDPFNPLSNAYAAMNYAKSRYGRSNLEGVIGHGHGYDQGGWLKPGTTIVHNKTGKPEPVLNPEQWNLLKNRAAAGTTFQFGDSHGLNAKDVAREFYDLYTKQQALHPVW